MVKNYKMANKGVFLENMLEFTNEVYKNRGIANVQKIPIPIKILKESKGKIVNGYREKKSTVDYRGTISPGIPVSFDAKETADEEGLPMANIIDHQIDFMRQAMGIGEITFLICYMSKFNKTYYIPGETVIEKWDLWQANKGKIGFNTIYIQDMIPLNSGRGVPIDYEAVVRKMVEVK